MASLRSLTGAFRALAMPSGAGSSRAALQPARFAPLRPTLAPPALVAPDAVRCASNLAPRRTKYRKSHKGRVPIPIGGSLKGTTLSEGAYGLRLLAPARLSAKQLTAAETALKRKLKVIKGAQVFMRVFPDIPVCVKGNETRMGKGKGTFEFWACRAPIGRVIFEIGGPVDIRPEVAKEALRLASAKLPVPTEFIDASAGPRLGSLSEVLPPASAAARSGAGIVVPAGAPVPPA